MDVVRAMEQDSGIPLANLRVDGGMVANRLLMQFQADMLDVQVIAPKVTETTALGAAYAAGLAVGFWSDKDELKKNWVSGASYEADMDNAKRIKLYKGWKKAISKSLDWL